MKGKKIILMFIVVIFITAILGGCKVDPSNSQSESQSTSQSSVNADPVNLIAWLQNTGGSDYTKALSDSMTKFTAANPDIKIRFEIVATDGINSKISVAAATNTLPDMQDGSPLWFMQYAYLNKLVALDGLFDKAEYDPGLLTASFSANGKVYVLPFGAAAPALWFNKTMFEKAGALDLIPKDIKTTWTIDQFKKAAKAVTDPAKKQYGFGLYAGDQDGDQTRHFMLWAFGASSFNADDTQCILNSAEGAEGMQFLVDLVTEALVPPGCAGLTGAQMNTMIMNGQIGMFKANTGDISYYKKGIKDGKLTDYEMVMRLFPSKDGKTSETCIQGGGYCLWNTGDDVRIAASKKYLQDFMKPENLKPFVEIEKKAGSIYPGKSMRSVYDPATPEGQVFDLYQYAKDIGVAVPGYAEIRAAYFPEVQAALTKAKTPKQALDDFVKKANEIIAANKMK